MLSLPLLAAVTAIITKETLIHLKGPGLMEFMIPEPLLPKLEIIITILTYYCTRYEKTFIQYIPFWNIVAIGMR